MKIIAVILSIFIASCSFPCEWKDNCCECGFRKERSLCLYMETEEQAKENKKMCEKINKE